MKVHNKILKAFGALLIAALLFGAMPAGEVKAATLIVGPGGTYTTIQTAIADASAGDTIEVAAGTYVEDLSMPYPVNLIGDGMPVIQGVLNIDHSSYSGSESTLLEGIRFETLSDAKHDNIVLKGVDGITIKDCEFDGAGKFMTDGARAVQMSNPNNNVTIEGSTFGNGYYVTINSYATGLTVKNSTIENVKSGINLQGGGDLVVEDSNISVIAQGAGNDTYGIRFASSAGTAENMTVLGGSISVDKNGLVAEAGTYHSAIVLREVASGDLSVEKMAIDGEVVNLSSTSLDASPNWWGSAAGPATGTVEGDVKVNPWCYNEACTELYVADGGSIQDAIDAASDGDTIHVAAGTYPEQLVLNKKDITVKSTDGAAATFVDVPDGTLTTGVKVLANMGTVTFDGFTVKNFTESGIMQGLSAREGTTFHVLNNKVTPHADYLKNGIQVTGDNSSVIGNEVDGQYLTENWGSSGIGVVDASHVTVNDNKINGPGAYGIAVYAYYFNMSEITLTGNTIDGSDKGIIVLAYNYGGSDHSVTNVAAHNNTVINYPVNAFWVEVRKGEGTITDVDLTENWWGSAAGPMVFDIQVDPNEVTYTPWCGNEACTTFFPNEDNEIVLPEGVTGEEIQTAINNAPSGTTIIYPAGGGTYTGGKTINNPGLTINLNGATIGPGSPAFTVTADNTIINGPGTLDGGVSTDHAIVVVDGVTGFTLDMVEIKRWADGLHFNGVINNTVIADNFIHDNTGDGVYFGAQPVDQTGYSFYIQGNLFKHNGGVGVNNAGTTDVNAEYNSWGDYVGAAGPEGDGATSADTDPFTHVDLYMVSTNPDVDNWPNQVFVDEDITYQVKAHMVNVTAAAFEFSYPTDLLGSPVFSSVNANFYPVPTKTEIVTVNETTGVISFEGQTGDNSVALTPLTGDIVLFEVTFTATSTPGTATLDFNEETDEFGMSTNNGPSNNIYADAMVDATLDVITRPTLTAMGIEGPYVAGISQEINIETCNAETGGDWIESVAPPIEPDTIAWLRITDVTIAEIARLQFLYDGEWFDFDVQDAYGGDAVQQDSDDVIARFGNYNFGMEIPVDWCDYDAFRVTFVEPGFHDITIELYDMMDTPQNGIGGDDILLTDLGPITIEVLGDFDVTGTIAMQGRTVRSGVPLTLTDVNGEPIYGPINTTSTSELAYNVLFPAGVNGSIYEITTSQPRYLNVHDDLDKRFLVNGDYTIDALELKGGNAVWENHASSNNKIDIFDASEVGSKYGSTGDLDADVNFDGKVSIQDLALVGGNFDLTSTEAYADWLTPEYNGSVSGIVTDDGAGNISGSVSGDYNLTIAGHFTGGSGGFADFTGTVSGDFAGTITGTVYERGTDPLYATITGTGADETVRLVGAFVKSGIDGHFKGQIITGPELDPVTDVTISGLDTVAVGNTIDLDVATTPAGRQVIWSVHANHTAYASIDQDGILTGLAESPGTIEIIVVVIDDSSFSTQSHWVTVTP